MGTLASAGCRSDHAIPLAFGITLFLAIAPLSLRRPLGCGGSVGGGAVHHL
jgi:hypothetical protein